MNIARLKLNALVNKLAQLTGTKGMPALKRKLGYQYEPHKFEVAGLTPVQSQTVDAPRALECPIQLETVVAAQHGIMDDDPEVKGLISALEDGSLAFTFIPALWRRDMRTGSTRISGNLSS